MGLEDIRKAILDEAKEEGKRIVAEAKEVADKIKKEAEGKVKEKEAALDKELVLVLEPMEVREVASAQFKARKMVLVRKREMLDELFDRCLQEVSKLSPTVRKSHVTALATQGKAGFSSPVVFTNKKDNTFVSQATVAEIPFAGGVIVENQDGSRRVTLTYESLLDDIRKNNLAVVATELFGK